MSIDHPRLEDFVNKWRGSEGSEQSHGQSFLNDLCDALDVPRPDQKRGDDPAEHRYVFERHVNIPEGDGVAHLGRTIARAGGPWKGPAAARSRPFLIGNALADYGGAAVPARRSAAVGRPPWDRTRAPPSIAHVLRAWGASWSG